MTTRPLSCSAKARRPMQNLSRRSLRKYRTESVLVAPRLKLAKLRRRIGAPPEMHSTIVVREHSRLWGAVSRRRLIPSQLAIATDTLNGGAHG